MPQPGASRLLRLAFPRETAPLSAPRVLGGDGGSRVGFSLRGARVQSSANETALIFTRDETARGGTRNLWRASLGSEYSRDGATGDGTFGLGAALLQRAAPFPAAPLTRLRAPFFAAEAAPLPDQNALLCATNFDPQNASRTDDEDAPLRSRIARFDVKSARLMPLTPRSLFCSAPAPSPSGERFAFVLGSSNAPAVCVADLNNGGLFTYRRVASFARSPRWLDDETLLVASTRGGGLRRVRVSRNAETTPRDDASQQLFSRAGDSAISPDGRLIFVATDAPTGTTLYWMAADGSGAQRLASAGDAAAPDFSPDGSALFYDAPADEESDASTRDESERGLWFAPMRRIAPTALLLEVKANLTSPRLLTSASNAPVLNVIGTAFSAGDDAPQVRLEWGDGVAPSRWNTLPASAAPIHAAPLAQWNLPPQTRGEKTLRLTVTDAFGDRAQSLLTLSFPLETESETPRLATLPDDQTPPFDGASTRTSPNMNQDDAGNSSPLSVSDARNAPRADSKARAFATPGAASTNDVSQNARQNPSAATPNARAATPPKPRFRVAPSRDASDAIAALPPPAPRPDAQQILDARRAATSASGNRATPDAIVLPDIAPAAPSSVNAAAQATANGANAAADDADDVDGETLAPAVPLPHRLPPQREPKRRASTRSARTAQTRTAQSRSDAASTDALPSDALPAAGELPIFPAPLPRTPTPSRPAPKNESGAVAAPRDDAAPRRVTFIGKRDDAATLTVAPVPASLKTGETLNLDVTARNNGKADWSSDGEAPVRLIAMWFNADGGRRTGYRIRWVRGAIGSGETARLGADLNAPSRAGKYFLVLTMARLNGADYQPPRDYAALKNAADSGHFGTRTFRVTVK